MNSKGQVGSTMTWGVATVLVVVILGVSFLLAGYISVFESESEINKISRGIGGGGLEVDMQIFDLIDKNYDVISEWVDDDFVLEHQQFIFGDLDERMEVVCSKFEEDEGVLDLNGKDFYLVVKETKEVIRISDSGVEGSFLCSTYPSNQELSTGSLMPFISFGGNVVGVGYV